MGTPSSGILIDAGVSCRRLTQALAAHGIPIDAVKAILITHAHSDHISGLRVFLRKCHAPVYATADTLAAIEEIVCLPSHTQLYALETGRTVHIADFSVTAFDTMHDIAGSCGYRLTLSDGQSCAVCTDLGCVTQEVLDGVYGADLVLLEANYDAVMLRNGSYPPPLQRRIRGDYGHLSNRDSGMLAVKLVKGGTTRIILGHLSENNNTMELAEQAVLETLMEKQLRRNKDFLLYTAAPAGLEQAVIF